MNTIPIILDRFVTRRTHELEATTRSEILTSIGAAFFFVAVTSWRFQSSMGWLPQLGLAAVLLWTTFIFYRFRAQITGPRKTNLAATGLEHYRAALTHRRDHLKNTWLWHGPMLLACLTLISILMRNSSAHLRNIAPFTAILILWIILAQTRRNKHAAELQLDLDELEPNPPAASHETPPPAAPPA